MTAAVQTCTVCGLQDRLTGISLKPSVGSQLSIYVDLWQRRASEHAHVCYRTLSCGGGSQGAAPSLAPGGRSADAENYVTLRLRGGVGLVRRAVSRLDEIFRQSMLSGIERTYVNTHFLHVRQLPDVSCKRVIALALPLKLHH